MGDEDKTRDQLLEELTGLRRKLMEKQEREDRFRLIADFTHDWEYWLGPNRQFHYISPSVERITGYTAADFIDFPGLLEQIVHPEDKDVFARHLANCDGNSSSRYYELEYRIITKDNSVAWIEHRCRPVFLADGSYGGQRVSNRDITARKRIAERLEVSEAQLRATLEASTEAVFLMDTQGKLLIANQTTMDRMNTDLETLKKGTMYDFLPVDVAESRRKMVQYVIESGKPVQFQDERLGKAFLNSIYPVIGKDGKVQHLAIFGLDVTAERRVRAEIEDSRRQLEQANRMLQMVIDTIPMRIFWKDLNSVYLGCNRLFARDAGRQEPSELVGIDDFSIGWKEQIESFRKDDQDVMRMNRPKINFEELQNTSEGNQRWFRKTKAPLVDLEGNVIGVLGTYDDITERKQMEERLWESEERYRNLFQNNHAIQLVIDPDGGRIIDANPAACQYYGYDPDTFKTKKITDINVLSPRQIFEEMARAKAEQRNQFYFPHRLANGEIRPVEVFSGPIILEGKQLLYSIVHDISERKKAEEGKEKLILELKDALSRIKVLSGLLPICASCKKIRNDIGYWEQLEGFIQSHSEAEFTHSICPECAKKLYPEFFKEKGYP